MDRGAADWPGPLPPGGPEAVRQAVAASGFGRLGTPGLTRSRCSAPWDACWPGASADPAHPHCAAHLHCPPGPSASRSRPSSAALNQSLDSWTSRRRPGDRAGGGGYAGPPVGYRREQRGVLTSGGTESGTSWGCSLARDEVLRLRFDADPDLDGIPPLGRPLGS